MAGARKVVNWWLENREKSSLEYKWSYIQYCLGCKSKCTFFVETWFTEKKKKKKYKRSIYFISVVSFLVKIRVCYWETCALVDCEGKTEWKVEQSSGQNLPCSFCSRTVCDCCKAFNAFYGQKVSFLLLLFSCLLTVECFLEEKW